MGTATMASVANSGSVRWSDLKRHGCKIQSQFSDGVVRTQESVDRYQRYKDWCAARRLSNEEYVLKHTSWSPNGTALAPNLSPYAVESGVWHFVLWHHPELVPGSTELSPQGELEVLRDILQAHGAQVTEDEVIIFQNEATNRSLPTIAHTQVFFRPS